jgi:hypothetical protein
MKYRSSSPIFIFFIFFLLFNMNSCSKLQDSLQRNGKSVLALATVDSATIYNCIWLVGNQIVDAAADSGQQIGVNAAFTDSITKQLVSINALSINARSLVANPDNTFHFGYSDSSAYLQEGLNLYGTNVKMKITGSSSADTVTQTIYMPKNVSSGSTNFPFGQINMANNLTLNWIPDAGNAWGSMVIKIWYNGSMSRFLNDSTLPLQDTTLMYTVPDNGSYTISSSDLQRLKVNSYVLVSLGRGSQAQAVLPVSKKRVFYYATASESSPPITLICTANWQNTGATPQCQASPMGGNTGYELIQQKDLSTCSATYNQTRWVVGPYNTTVCPL